ncbi:MAG: UbiD family decarboxylase [Planctomycetia bacterium]|jgi:4-hydroxy-3-polyprenylbenzoate decarboxylase
MPYTSLADFLERLEPQEPILRTDQPVDPMAPLGTEEGDSRAVLLGTIRGRRFPMVGRLMCSPTRIRHAIGVADWEEAARRVEKFLATVDRSDADRVVKQAPAQQVVRLASDLDESIFPSLCLSGDATDQQITAATLFTLDPDSGRRVGTVIPWTVASATRLVPCRTTCDPLGPLRVRYAELGRPMPVAICAGGDPAVRLAAEAPSPCPVDPCRLGAALRGQAIEVVACRTLEKLTVPADSDMIIEGFLVGAPAPPCNQPLPTTPNENIRQDCLSAEALDVQAVTHRINPVLPFAVPSESAIVRRTLLAAMLPWWRAELPGLADLVLPAWGDDAVLVGSVEKAYAIDPDVFNDRCAIANAAVPAGFAGFPAAERSINNADLDNKSETLAAALADHPVWSDLRLVVLLDETVDLASESAVLAAMARHADFGKKTLVGVETKNPK